MKDICQWYVSVQQPECGEPAEFAVLVTGKVITAQVTLCKKHKQIHDETFARIRKARDSRKAG